MSTLQEIEQAAVELSESERKELLRFRPQFRRPELTLAPDNLTEAETRGPGLTPLFPSSEDLALEIETPNGETLSASDPALPGLIGGDQFDASDLTIIRSDSPSRIVARFRCWRPRPSTASAAQWA